MKLVRFREKFMKSLEGEYPREEVNSFFTLLARAWLGMSRLQVALEPDKELSGEELISFEAALGRLSKHEPIQYIIGETEFFGLNLKVNSQVLIPRPETEELVQWILDDCRSGQISAPKILDIGTGSGCIAISLAKNLPEARVVALDISGGALKTAKENAQLNRVDLEFRQKNILETEELETGYDIIVSNPPYVREQEKKEMHRNVLQNEPEQALYVKDQDPLLFYDRIGGLAKESLKSTGKLYFEINQYLAEETQQLIIGKGFAAELKRDIFGNYRMLKGEHINQGQ